MPIICFFGPDGSGKTTIVKALAKKLRSRGFKASISWMRGTHTLAFLIANFLPRFGAFRGPDNPYYGISVPQSFREFWQLLEFVSLLPVLLAKFLLPSIFGFTVVAERYLPDFIVWVSITTKDPAYPDSLPAKFLRSLTMRCEARIYVTAEPEALLQRRGSVDQPFVPDQVRLYERIAKSLGAFRLDTTNRSLEESKDIVLNLIKGPTSSIHART